VKLCGAGAQARRRKGDVASGDGNNQALGGAWFKWSASDDVRGDKSLLLGGVAIKVTAHTPAS